jgi:hypothetical protein
LVAPLQHRALSGVGVAGRVVSVNQAFQQNENAQLIKLWWRRIAVSERTWKSAHPRSSFACL